MPGFDFSEAAIDAYMAIPLHIRLRAPNTDFRKFLDTSVSYLRPRWAGSSYRAEEAGAQPTAQSEWINA